MKHEQMNVEEVNAVINYFKPNDSGKYGKAFEVITKVYFNGNKGNSRKVAAKGHCDMIYHGKKYEIKSNCGELNDDLMSKDYVVYSMDNMADCYNCISAVVMTPTDFLNMLDNVGLIRTKPSRSSVKIKHTIQSYNNSKRKTALLLGALAQFPTVDEWVVTH